MRWGTECARMCPACPGCLHVLTGPADPPGQGRDGSEVWTGALRCPVPACCQEGAVTAAEVTPSGSAGL